MTYNEAVNKARRLAKKNDRDYYVVHVPGDVYGPYDACDVDTLETFYTGISEQSISCVVSPDYLLPEVF